MDRAPGTWMMRNDDSGQEVPVHQVSSGQEHRLCQQGKNARFLQEIRLSGINMQQYDQHARAQNAPQ